MQRQAEKNNKTPPPKKNSGWKSNFDVEIREQTIIT